VLELLNSQTTMRRSFFFGNHNGTGLDEGQFIAESIIVFLNRASQK